MEAQYKAIEGVISDEDEGSEEYSKYYSESPYAYLSYSESEEEQENPADYKKVSNLP